MISRHRPTMLRCRAAGRVPRMLCAIGLGAILWVFPAIAQSPTEPRPATPAPESRPPPSHARARRSHPLKPLPRSRPPPRRPCPGPSCASRAISGWSACSATSPGSASTDSPIPTGTGPRLTFGERPSEAARRFGGGEALALRGRRYSFRFHAEPSPVSPAGERLMFRGWYVVGAAFLIAVWSWGLAFYGLGIYLVALGREHGWSIAAISVAITTYYLMGAGATASVGGAMRRIGAHRVVAAGVIAMAAGVAALGSIDALWQLYLALASMALGWSAMSGAAINILVAPWFERKRGVAVSLALTGASGGGVIVAPALLALIAHLGFAPALRVAALAMAAMLLPVTALVLRRSPGELGLRPDGDPRPVEASIAAD